MFKLNGSYIGEKKLVVDKNNWAFNSVQKMTKNKAIEDGEYLKHISNCVVSISPARHAEPVLLFGAKQKTITTNKITIREALVNKHDVSDIVHGEILAEFVISDENLSCAFIKQGGNEFPCTVKQIGDVSLELDIKPIDDSISRNEKMLREDVAKHEIYLLEAVEELRKEMKKAKPSSKKLELLIGAFKSHTYNLKADAKHVMQVLSEELSKDINSVKFEINSTIQKLKLYKDSELLNLLTHKETNKESDNYLYWYMNGGLEVEEINILIDIFKNILDKKEDEKVSKYVNSLEKRYTGRDRNTSHLQHACLSVHSIYGDCQLSHEENNSSSTMEFRFSSCRADDSSSGAIRYQALREMLRIQFSVNDLMMLVRSSEDEFVFGTITRYAGNLIPLVKIQNYIEDNIKLDYQFKGSNDKLLDIVLELTELMGLKSIKKDEKILINKLILDFERELPNTKDKIYKSSVETRNDISLIYQDKLRQSLNKTISKLPNNLGKQIVLLLK